MKRIFTTITLLAMIFFAGCTDLDDIYSRLDDQKEELANIKSLANAMANKLSVVSYKELDDRSGYELTMSNGSKIILKHGNKGPEGDQGSQGEQGEPGAPGQDGDANLTITETADGIIIEYKGESYILPKFPTMTLTTAKSVEETLELWIDAAEADRSGVWIDLNNNGEKDDGEAVNKFEKYVEYTLGTQTVTVYGKVTVLNCKNNQLTSLDVSNNTLLTFLDCSSNQLTSLDVSNKTELMFLGCYRNQLSFLDVSNNTALTELYCFDNQLTSIDVSNNTALTELHCNNNQLTSLEVSNNKKLEELYCFDNQLTSLDVSNNKELEFLWCYNNPLTTLNVSSNTALMELRCNNNQLTSLDVSNNKELMWLSCFENQLTTLDVSNNKELWFLSCGDNQLTSLDVSKNTLLEFLLCFNNKISGDKMTALVNSLPDYNDKVVGKFWVIAKESDTEQNVINAAQAAVATGKNWIVQDSDGNLYTPGS